MSGSNFITFEQWHSFLYLSEEDVKWSKEKCQTNSCICLKSNRKNVNDNHHSKPRTNHSLMKYSSCHDLNLKKILWKMGWKMSSPDGRFSHLNSLHPKLKLKYVTDLMFLHNKTKSLRHWRLSHRVVNVHDYLPCPSFTIFKREGWKLMPKE